MNAQPRRRLLTIAHSYCVELNRRLAQEMAAQDTWDVTAVGPTRFRGDFGWHVLEPRQAEGCTVVPVPVHLSRPVHLMLYSRQLARLLREPWDLVHCWEEPYVLAAGQVAFSTPRRVPFVFATFQNIDKRYPPPFRWIEQYTLGRAAGIIAFGRTARKVIVERAPLDVPTRVISPGVDIAQFKPDPEARACMRHRWGWHDDVPAVGFLGRLVSEKGCSFLTRVLDRLDMPWRALIVGSGPLEPELRKWGLLHGDRVRVETAVRHDEVAAYVNAMDLLCAPSLTTGAWREQFGRMLIEALACGVPVVASDSGEIPHVVADAGVIVREGDESAWAAAIARLLTADSLRTDLARRGRRRAVERFAWPVIARQHLDFFDEIVSRTPGAWPH